MVRGAKQIVAIIQFGDSDYKVNVIPEKIESSRR